MSATLGPIHIWLYKKIKFQDNINDFLAEKYNLNYNSLGNSNLEDVIDEMNIHGYLQGKINEVESGYNKLITEILKKTDIEEIYKVIFQYGEEHELKLNSPQDIYKELTDLMLDGMPCDRSIEVVDSFDDYIKWELVIDVHSPFWENIEIYHNLRTYLINGMVKNAGFILKNQNNTFTLERC
ncbi:MAG: hypothetical protein ACK5LT_02585 [Lachnospirales bacterium]